MPTMTAVAYTGFRAHRIHGHAVAARQHDVGGDLVARIQPAAAEGFDAVQDDQAGV